MACCFDYCSFSTTHFLLLFCFIVMIGTNLFGLIKINWTLSYEINHVLYIIDFIISFVSFITCTTFICLRSDVNRINSPSNRFCIYATYYVYIICSAKLVSIGFTIYKVYLDFVEFDQVYAKNMGKDTDYLYKNGQWFYFLGSMIPNAFFNLLIYPILHSVLLRLQAKIMSRVRYDKVGEDKENNELADEE